ncbi:MAG: hypothetical protein JWQ44_1282, partial [Chthoniobacter sp.]|nr:hypothetical protein [Chthoniobacter sp.]
IAAEDRARRASGHAAQIFSTPFAVVSAFQGSEFTNLNFGRIPESGSENLAMRLLNLLRRTPTVADLPEPILPAVNAQMVSPREQRSPEAVAGPFYVVSDQCIICDLPPETAPSSIRFHFTANCGDCPHYCYVYKQPETREELDRIIEAARRSCVEAIRYCGTDPYVLQRLSVAGYARLCDAL